MAWIQLVGAAISAVGSIRQGQAQAGAAKYNAAIAEQNAEIADSQSIAAGEAQQRDAQRKMGSALAAFGASGADASSGSALDVLADSARQSSLDAATLKYNYQLRRNGYLAQSALDYANADNARSASYLNATSSLLQGAGRYYGSQGGGTPIPSTG